MRSYIFFCLMLLSTTLFSQNKRIDTVKSVTILEKKVYKYITSSQIMDTTLTSNYANTSIQQLLQYHTNVMVRNYGVGGISTISIRGSSAAQTQLLWNGVNINNASTGISDFNALPVSFFDNIKIEYGQGLANSVVGGSIRLENNKPIFTKQRSTNISLGYETLKNYAASLQKSISTHRFANSFRLQLNKANNKYSFFNEDKNKHDTLAHAGSQQYQFLNDMHFKLLANTTLSWHAWGQLQKREIAPTTFEERSTKAERNITFRTLVNFERERLYSWKWTHSLGAFIENYRYNDSLLQVKTNTSVLHIPYTTSYTMPLRYRQRVTAYLSTQSSYLLYANNENIRRVYASLHHNMYGFLKHLNIHSFIQKEWTNVFSLPLIASFSVSGKLFPSLNLYSSISSSYRTPTLNELYYFPGGNKNLKPEESKNVEMGGQYKKVTYRHMLSIDGAMYQRSVKNWITWYGSSILTPQNILRVDSKGLECMLNYSFQPRPLISKSTEHYELIVPIEQQLSKNEKGNNFMGWRINAGLLYAYTLSTTKESALRNDYSIGKQIPYVPRYQAKATLGVDIRKLSISYFHTYAGYRFVTTDESQFLKPYQTGNVNLLYSINHKAYSMNFTARCNNIFNEHFESIVGRVMPKRNVSLGITFHTY